MCIVELYSHFLIAPERHNLTAHAQVRIMRAFFFISIFLTASTVSVLASPSVSVAIRFDTNRIDGVVWDPARRPVPDVYVELRNSMEGDLGRARTNGTGRFTFYNLSTGRFKLHVITTGTNLLEDTQDVEILGTALRTSSETQYVEFNLKYDPRKIELGSGGPAEAVFVQDVPDAARKLFKKGASDVHSVTGIKAVEDAIIAYPDYFDALSAAGKEYVARGDFAKGAVYLVRAVTVNPRSVSSYNSLAYAAYKLGKISEATEAARIALTLDPKAINSRIDPKKCTHRPDWGASRRKAHRWREPCPVPA